MKMAYKFRLYPTKEQEQKLLRTLDRCRYVYNFLLSELQQQKFIDRSQLQEMIVDLKRIEPELKNIHSKTLQYECYKLFSNLSALSQSKKKHRKIGRLRFKGKKFFDTMTYNQSGFELKHTFKEKGRLQLSKIGNIKIKLHRVPKGNIKQITIKRINNKWFAFLISDGIIKLEKTI